MGELACISHQADLYRLAARSGEKCGPGQTFRGAWKGVAVTAALALALAGCASTPDGPEHVMRPGENLYRLSRYYGVSVDAIKRANHIGDATAIQVGERLVIPGAAKAPPAGSLAYVPEAAAASHGSRASRRALARRETDLEFTWPVRGHLSSKFGRRRGRRHEGIDIPAKAGTPVHAAEAGRVIHSGRGLGDYGKVVIVKHAGRYSTVYAHNRRNRVRKGEFVEKGQVIAEVGKTGNASGAHVHFELRRDRRPEDPLLYLP
jgi:murein DD-endopeptidase MepM/ murein hydrolase activator NlpD